MASAPDAYLARSTGCASRSRALRVPGIESERWCTSGACGDTPTAANGSLARVTQTTRPWRGRTCRQFLQI